MQIALKERKTKVQYKLHHLLLKNLHPRPPFVCWLAHYNFWFHLKESRTNKICQRMQFSTFKEWHFLDFSVKRAVFLQKAATVTQVDMLSYRNVLKWERLNINHTIIVCYSFHWNIKHTQGSTLKDHFG